MAVGGAEVLEGRDRRMTRANRTGYSAGCGKARERIFEPRNLAIEHGDVEMLSHSGRIASAECGQHRDHRVERGR